MKLQDQVVSLELAKRLKELGLPQTAFWSWYEATDRDDEPRLNRSDEHCSVCTLCQQAWEAKYSAFTTAELGGLLPKQIHSNGEWGWYSCLEYDLEDDYENGKLLAEKKKVWRWVCQYRYNGDFDQGADTEADARAKMLIYLIENDLIKL